MDDRRLIVETHADTLAHTIDCLTDYVERKTHTCIYSKEEENKTYNNEKERE